MGGGESEVACWQVYQLVEVCLRTRALSPAGAYSARLGIPPWFPGGVIVEKGKVRPCA